MDLELYIRHDPSSCLGNLSEVFYRCRSHQSKNPDKTITMISDASDVNRAHRFNISELESAQRIYKIAFASPEELIEDTDGPGMVALSQVKYLRISPSVSTKWADTAISETDRRNG